MTEHDKDLDNMNRRLVDIVNQASAQVFDKSPLFTEDREQRAASVHQILAVQRLLRDSRAFCDSGP
eukprot:3829206-Pyramimonas_sp.AAC.1